MQQVILGIAFKTFETRSGVEYRYEWVEWYGMVMCLEMLVFSIFTIYAFNPRDLRLWEYSEGLISAERDDDIELSDMSSSEKNRQSAGIILPYKPRTESNTSLL